MKNLKRLLATPFIVLLSVMFVACTTGPGTTQPTEKPTEAAKEQDEKSEKITLELWHGATNRDDPSHVSVLNVIDAFRAENPNVTVHDSGQTTDNNKTRIRTAAAANELPDVFGTFGGAFSKDMAETGLLLDLTPYLDDEIKSQLKPGALATMTYDGKPYGLPDNGWVNLLYINTLMFDKYNQEIPTTVDEMIAASKVFRENGEQPFILGGKQGDTYSHLWDSVAVRIAGAEKLLASFTDPSVLDDPAFLKAAEIVYLLGEENVYADTCFNFVNPEAAAAFVTGEYAMAALNAGFVGLIEGPESKIAGKTIAIPTFVNVDGVENHESENQMGFTGQWAASSGTQDPDLAYELLKFISTSVSQFYYEGGSHQIGYIREDWDTSKQSNLYQEIDKMTQQFTDTIMPGTAVRAPGVTSELSNLTVALARNSITPEEFISQVKALY